MNVPVLNKHEFDLLRGLVLQQTGITLPDSKRVLLETRLRHRLRESGDDSFLSYYRRVCSASSGDELQELVDSVTTNVTSFFREAPHFQALAEEMVPAWLRRRSGTVSRVRVWSAACATGQEPYSIAAVLLPTLQRRPGLDWKVLGTDVSRRALRTATTGRYPLRALAEIPEPFRGAFHVSRHGESRHVAASDELRAVVVLRALNLMAESYPFSGAFDAIFCRNVLIYFDPPTRRHLLEKMVRVLSPGGYLVLGLAESLIEHVPGLVSVGHSIYQRAAAQAGT